MTNVQKVEEFEKVILSADESFLDASSRGADASATVYHDLKRVLKGTTHKNILIVAEYPIKVYLHVLQKAAKRIIETDGVRRDINSIFFLNEETNKNELVYSTPGEPKG